MWVVCFEYYKFISYYAICLTLALYGSKGNPHCIKFQFASNIYVHVCVMVNLRHMHYTNGQQTTTVQSCQIAIFQLVKNFLNSVLSSCWNGIHDVYHYINRVPCINYQIYTTSLHNQCIMFSKPGSEIQSLSIGPWPYPIMKTGTFLIMHALPLTCSESLKSYEIDSTLRDESFPWPSKQTVRSF